MFSTEKSWGEADSAAASTESAQTTQFFKLNLTKLAKSLATIPFYERQSYDVGLFDAGELCDMDVKAANSRNNCHDVTPTTVQTIDGGGALALQKKQATTMPYDTPHMASGGGADVHNSATATTVAVDVDDELNDLLMLGVKPLSTIDNSKMLLTGGDGIVEDVRPVAVVKAAATSNDIQQWLDDILDD